MVLERGARCLTPCKALASVFGRFFPVHSLPHGAPRCTPQPGPQQVVFICMRRHQVICEAVTESDSFDVLGDKTQVPWQEGRFWGLEN